MIVKNKHHNFFVNVKELKVFYLLQITYVLKLISTFKC